MSRLVAGITNSGLDAVSARAFANQLSALDSPNARARVRGALQALDKVDATLFDLEVAPQSMGSRKLRAQRLGSTYHMLNPIPDSLKWSWPDGDVRDMVVTAKRAVRQARTAVGELAVAENKRINPSMYMDPLEALRWQAPRSVPDVLGVRAEFTPEEIAGIRVPLATARESLSSASEVLDTLKDSAAGMRAIASSLETSGLH